MWAVDAGERAVDAGERASCESTAAAAQEDSGGLLALKAAGDRRTASVCEELSLRFRAVGRADAVCGCRGSGSAARQLAVSNVDAAAESGAVAKDVVEAAVVAVSAPDDDDDDGEGDDDVCQADGGDSGVRARGLAGAVASSLAGLSTAD